MAKTLTVETPASLADPAAVEIEEIPLPPEEEWAGLSGADAAAPPAPAAAPRPAARLDFLEPGETVTTVTLVRPFRLDGEVVRCVTIRRLTLAEAARFADDLRRGDADNADFAAHLAGLPAEVIRGMDAEDGIAVVTAALDFLPPSYQRAVGWASPPATSAGGDASP
jgi:hypothetical protein